VAPWGRERKGGKGKREELMTGSWTPADFQTD